MLHSLYPSLANLKLASSKCDVCRPRASAYTTAAVGGALTAQDEQRLAGASEEDTFCQICFASLQDAYEVQQKGGLRVACSNGHIFHTNCLHTWIRYSGDKQNVPCPQCRSKIDSSDINEALGKQAPSAPLRPSRFARKVNATEQEADEDKRTAQTFRELAEEADADGKIDQAEQYRKDAQTFELSAQMLRVRNVLRLEIAFEMSDEQLLALEGEELQAILDSPSRSAYYRAAQRRKQRKDDAASRLQGRDQPTPTRRRTYGAGPSTEPPGSPVRGSTADGAGGSPRTPPHQLQVSYAHD